MKYFLFLSASLIIVFLSSSAFAQSSESVQSELTELLSGLPDQIMGVLLAFLAFKAFIDMVK